MKFRIVKDGFENFIPQWKYKYWPFWFNHYHPNTLPEYSTITYKNLKNALEFITKEMNYYKKRKLKKLMFGQKKKLEVARECKFRLIYTLKIILGTLLFRKVVSLK